MPEPSHLESTTIMSSRLKSTASIESKAQFDATVDEIVKLQLDREQFVTERDRLIASVQEDHNPEIERIGTEIAAKLVLCEKFATVHRESLFAKLKSAASSLAIYGFRTGNPKLVLLNRKWKWDDVTAALKAKERTDLIRRKEEADKDALKKLSDEELAGFGCRIDQDETFFIEPKREDPERLQS
jgi:phage host-nuclease inhibitor protein Gam